MSTAGDQKTKELVDMLLEAPQDANRYYTSLAPNEAAQYTNTDYARFMEGHPYMYSEVPANGASVDGTHAWDHQYAAFLKLNAEQGNQVPGALNPMAMSYLAPHAENPYNQDEASFVQSFAVQPAPFLHYPAYLAGFQQPFANQFYSQQFAYSFGQPGGFGDAGQAQAFAAAVGPDGQPQYFAVSQDGYQSEPLDPATLRMYQLGNGLAGMALQDDVITPNPSQPPNNHAHHPPSHNKREQSHAKQVQQQQQQQTNAHHANNTHMAQNGPHANNHVHSQAHSQSGNAQAQHGANNLQAQQKPKPKQDGGPRSWADVLSAPAPKPAPQQPPSAGAVSGAASGSKKLPPAGGANNPSFSQSGLSNSLSKQQKTDGKSQSENFRARSDNSNENRNENRILGKLAPPYDKINPSSFDYNIPYARFFVIKSYSEDDIHKSIKYAIWASTDSGNRRLDAAYRESAAQGPIYLFFSVNSSGQFCGMAQMTTPLDYSKKCEYWAQDKWNGQFAVNWIYIKDIPNSHLRYIRLTNNDNKPVTNSRDTQEVLLEPGKELLRIFVTYNSKTSIIDDFSFYDKRQELMKEKKTQTEEEVPETDLLPIATGESRKQRSVPTASPSTASPQPSTSTPASAQTSNSQPSQAGNAKPSSSSSSQSSSATSTTTTASSNGPKSNGGATNASNSSTTGKSGSSRKGKK